MANEQNNSENNGLNNGDILNGASSEQQSNRRVQKSTNSSTLHHLDETATKINKNLEKLNNIASKASLSGSIPYYQDKSYSTSDKKQSNTTSSSSFKSSASKRQSSSGMLDDFLDGFEKELCESLGIPYIGDDVEETVKNTFNKWASNVASALEIDTNELPKTIGKEFAKIGMDKLEKSNSDAVKAVRNYAAQVTDKFKKTTLNAKNAYDEYLQKNMKTEGLAEKLKWDNVFGNGQSDVVGYDEYKGNRGTSSTDTSGSFVDGVTGDIKDVITDNAQDKLIGGVTDAVGKGATKAFATGDLAALTGGLKAAAGELMAVAPELAVAVAALTVIDRLTESFGEFVERSEKALDKIASSSDRFDDTRWARVDAQEARFQKDAETFIKTPFKILEDAANKVYEVWDAALQTINATQGYTKSDLQDLMSAYASRLRSEGLSNVVGTTDVTSMLQSIIKQGLSGKVAEEFAYQATVLNKAIPTEDFTSYASSYASVAASYINAGHTQAEALEYANKQLQAFASSVLTASRQVSGGFTTSLTGVSNLFEDVVKIAQTGGVSDTTQLSSALSVVQAVAGQVSPSTGSDLVSQIVNAAVGGNSNNLVALRSLAGTGASNTAFLQALVRDPNNVLANMFSGLQSMFDKSTDNYMEVAYSLADTFGVSADALARIDWQKLVEELRNNSSSTSALNQNMNLLASGETTTSAEAQRLAQINQYMIDEGLSYVLDNEAARLIQQHMWDQEIADQMQQATYAVDFAGGALELMTSISSLLQDIVKTLTLGIVDFGGIAKSGKDYLDIVGDIKSLLQAGVVGEGNPVQYHNLTTYEVSNLIQKPRNYLENWGIQGRYDANGGLTNFTSATGSAFLSFPGYLTNSIYQAVKDTTGNGASVPTSKYSWASGKSSLQALNSPDVYPTLPDGAVSESATQKISSQTATKLNQWMSTMSDFISSGSSYEDWYNSASDYGFSDVSSTLSDLGYSDNDMRMTYADKATDYAVDQAIQQKQLESQFYTDGVTWIEQTYPADRDAWNTKYDTNVTAWFMTFSTQMGEWQTLYTDTMTNFQLHLDAKMSEWFGLYEEYTDTTHKKLQYLNNQFDNNFVNDFLYEWKDYYIGKHTHYREATNFDTSIRTITAERNQTNQGILALAKALTERTDLDELVDPAVQTNVLLGQVVVLLQSIFTAQQSGQGLTLPTALASLGLNITNPK